MNVLRPIAWSGDALVRVAGNSLPPSLSVRRARGLSWFARTKTSALLAIGMSLPGAFSAASAACTSSMLDAGGKRVGSASYMMDGSLGSLGGMAVAASPQVVARNGYVGQLYDVQSLALSASPPNVNEAATSQLAAKAILDDFTCLSLSVTSVAWSVAGGPIASINASGLASASNVYQDTPATVRADYQSKFGTLSLTVLNVNNDDFGIYAHDGIDDAWQVRYFGVGNTNAGPTADPDGDYQNNLFEYAADTVPTNSFSRFQLSIAPVTGHPAWMNLTFSPCLSNRTYAVLFNTNLSLGGFSSLASIRSSSNAAQVTFTDKGATNAARFYRVGITFPAQ
ncbi:MAG: hypothetical protein NTW03_05870 [Verrucomicrobia bacterium]|nr:hypothetical protein [Verrucomicrobiota bacterium]